MIRVAFILLIGALCSLLYTRADALLRSRGGGLSGITLIVAHGDSITQGEGVCPAPSSLPGTCPAAYPNQLALLVGSGATALNFGDQGAGINCCMGAISGETLLVSAPGEVDSFASNPGARLIIFGGTNDIYTVGNPTSTFSFFGNYITARITAGWPVNHIIVPEMISRLNDTLMPLPGQIAQWNSLLAGGVATYGYQEIPLGSDTLIGPTGKSGNLTYYLNDGIHPTAAGHILIAQDIFGPTASCSACPGIH